MIVVPADPSEVHSSPVGHPAGDWESEGEFQGSLAPAQPRAAVVSPEPDWSCPRALLPVPRVAQPCRALGAAHSSPFHPWAGRADTEFLCGSGAPAWICTPSPEVPCAAPWLSPAPWPGALAGPCLPTPQIWLQFVLAPSSSSPKMGKAAPVPRALLAGKPSCDFALDAPRAACLGIAHGPGMWFFPIAAIFPLQSRGKWISC